jgi:RHS repeat-associated protein
VAGSNDVKADQRYYDYGAGRFHTPDPAGKRAVDPKNPTTWNMYAYAGDDPVNFNDPRGLYELASGGSGDPWFGADDCTVNGLVDVPGSLCGYPGGPLPGPYETYQEDVDCYESLTIEISHYLGSKGSPLAGLADQFVADGQQYDVDPRFLVALSRAESTWGKNLTAKQGPYNAWSVSTHYYTGYSSFSAALNDVANLVGTDPRYIPGGNITAKGIYQVFNATFSLPYFNDTIVADMNKLGGDLNDVRFPCNGSN